MLKFFAGVSALFKLNCSSFGIAMLGNLLVLWLSPFRCQAFCSCLNAGPVILKVLYLAGPEQLSFGNFISMSWVVVYIARYPVTGNESN